MDETKSELYIVGIVGIIAVVAVVMLIVGAQSKAVVKSVSNIDGSGQAIGAVGVKCYHLGVEGICTTKSRCSGLFSKTYTGTCKIIEEGCCISANK